MSSLLYLRTKFVFNVKAGGSVTHTSGVINAMAMTQDIRILSNDELAGVQVPYDILAPKSTKLLPVAFRELSYSFKVLRLEKKISKPSAIYQRRSDYSFCGAALAKYHKCKYILEFNSSGVWSLTHWSKQHNWKSVSGFIMNLYKHLLEIPIVRWVENYNLKTSNTIIVVSEELKSQLIERGIPASKIVFYPNGVDPSLYSPEISGKSIRENYKFSDETHVFGFIGSFGQWHGIDIMAHSIVNFFAKHPEQKGKVKFLLIGDGVMMDKVVNILTDLNNPEDVILTGLVDQQEGVFHLAACDTLVSPHKPNSDGTKFFGSPTKLFEYMAMGKGIIASELEQIGHLLNHQDNAFLVEPNNAEALTEAYSYALNNPKEMSEMGNNARKQVIEKHTWDKHVEAILDHSGLL